MTSEIRLVFVQCDEARALTLNTIKQSRKTHQTGGSYLNIERKIEIAIDADREISIV